MSHELASRDAEKGKFAFSIYDFEGNGTMDAFYLGDCLRALQLNPTNAMVEKLGGTKMRKQKYFKVEEFLPIFAEVKNHKDQATKEDFMECLRLYDKHSDGKMLYAELQHILLALGEPLADTEVNSVLSECCPEEDEDGFINYEPFIKKLLTSE